MKRIVFLAAALMLLLMAGLMANRAHAVDVTITLSAVELVRLQAAVGKIKDLKDTQPTPQRRSATPAEVKAFVIEQTKQWVTDTERREAEIARGPVAVPAFNPQ